MLKGEIMRKMIFFFSPLTFWSLKDNVKQTKKVFFFQHSASEKTCSANFYLVSSIFWFRYIFLCFRENNSIHPSFLDISHSSMSTQQRKQFFWVKTIG